MPKLNESMNTNHIRVSEGGHAANSLLHVTDYTGPEGSDYDRYVTGNGFYFWDETEATAHGPFPCIADAIYARDKYFSELHPPEVTSPKFQVHDVLKHVATGIIVKVNGTPYQTRLERGNVPAYSYSERGDEISWVRSQKEMEDGRFEKVTPALLPMAECFPNSHAPKDELPPLPQAPNIRACQTWEMENQDAWPRSCRTCGLAGPCRFTKDQIAKAKLPHKVSHINGEPL